MIKSKKNAIILGLIIMTLLFGSMFLAIIAFQDIPKYNNPYIFTATICVIGILLGYLTWGKVKPIILKYSLKKNDDGTFSSMIIMIVIGLLLFVVNELNIYTASKTNCDSFLINNKYRQESGYRRPEINTLVINIENRQETVVCKRSKWIEKRIGDRINLCFYKSLLGLNYIEINE